MANDDETVEQVCDDIEHIPWGVYTGKIETDDECGISQAYCNELSDRIHAARKREIEAKDKEIAKLRKALSRVENITGDCRKCEECGDESCPWFGEPDGCNNREARDKYLHGDMTNLLVEIHQREYDIEYLRSVIKGEAESREKNDARYESEIAKRDALIKEMCEALYDASEDYTDRDLCRALIAKAREVVK